MPDVPRATRASRRCAATRSSPSRWCGSAWAGTAPIAGAIVASGVFVATPQDRPASRRRGHSRYPRAPGDTVMKASLHPPRRDRAQGRAESARLRAPAPRGHRGAPAGGDQRRQGGTLPGRVEARSSNPEVRTIVKSQRLTFEVEGRTSRARSQPFGEGMDGPEQRVVDGTKTQLAGVKRASCPSSTRNSRERASF